MNKVFSFFLCTILFLLHAQSCFSSQLENILTKIVNLDTWLTPYHIEFHNIQELNPGIKESSIKKYLRNAGFVKSQLYPPNSNVFYFRWVDPKTGYPVFYRDMDRGLLSGFTSGSSVKNSQPEYVCYETFDALEYKYEKHGITLYENFNSTLTYNYKNPQTGDYQKDIVNLSTTLSQIDEPDSQKNATTILPLKLLLKGLPQSSFNQASLTRRHSDLKPRRKALTNNFFPIF